MVPSVINGYAVKALTPSPLLDAMMNLSAETDHVLVIIQLNGGNDGLNMVIPRDSYALYKNARSNIAVPEDKILKLTGNDKTGLHPAMKGLQSLFNDGKLSIIDFKTAERMKDTQGCHDYFLQATAYAIMFQEVTGTRVPQIVIMMVSAEGEEQAFVESPKRFVPELKERIDEFYAEFDPDEVIEEIKNGHAN